MIENLQVVEKGELKKALRKLKEGGHRLITIIGAVRDGKMELTYALESADMSFAAVRTSYRLDEEIQSVQDIFINALLYEMELVDLFDVRVEGCAPGLLLEPEKRGPFRRDG
ncbi:MAG: NADH-quinone oxidoreductase subunit C [Thermoplasmata archaeon]